MYKGQSIPEYCTGSHLQVYKWGAKVVQQFFFWV